MSKRIKNLGTNLTKGVQNLDFENSKTLLKEIIKTLNNWKKKITCSCIETLKIVRIAIFIKILYNLSRFYTIPTGFPDEFLDIDKLNPKFIWNCTGSRRAKKHFENNNNDNNF